MSIERPIRVLTSEDKLKKEGIHHDVHEGHQQAKAPTKRLIQLAEIDPTSRAAVFQTDPKDNGHERKAGTGIDFVWYCYR